jgi:hypothetical protein
LDKSLSFARFHSNVRESQESTLNYFQQGVSYDSGRFFLFIYVSFIDSFFELMHHFSCLDEMAPFLTSINANINLLNQITIGLEARVKVQRAQHDNIDELIAAGKFLTVNSFFSLEND